MTNKKPQHRTTIVLPIEVQNKLHQLCLLYHLSKSSVISLLIDKEIELREPELNKLRQKHERGYCEVID
jgi:hypothetical protein